MIEEIIYKLTRTKIMIDIPENLRLQPCEVQILSYLKNYIEWVNDYSSVMMAFGFAIDMYGMVIQDYIKIQTLRGYDIWDDGGSIVKLNFKGLWVLHLHNLQETERKKNLEQSSL